MKGSFYTGNYRNVFLEMGYSQSEIDKKVHDAFEIIFHDKNEGFYFDVAKDMGYVVDTGNIDVRTEGMSYAMMMCVQLDKKEKFDRLWKWAMTYMYMTEGENAGYFAWSCQLDGTKNSYGPASDGEEYFAMALFFASNRWGDGKGIYEYSKWARQILHDCIHKGEDNVGYPMWEPSNKLIKFIPNCDFTDPSYHLPHFYELFALWANEEDKSFWKEAAHASREYLKKACHPDTGLSAEYATYDGQPYAGFNETHGRHDWFYSDSYRTIANIGLDYEWFRACKWQREIANTIQRFFWEREEGRMDGVYLIDGTPLEEKALHPVGLLATIAQASLAANGPYARECVERFWETPLRTGKRRYYDNCLYMFALLALSGKFKVWL